MSQYEFTSEQNKVISNVALRCKVNAVFLALWGLSSLLKTGLSWGDRVPLLSVVSIISGLVFVVMGVVFFRPSDNFQRVTTTEGNDITEVMTGLKELWGGFKLVSILIIVSLVLDVITIVFYAQ